MNNYQQSQAPKSKVSVFAIVALIFLILAILFPIGVAVLDSRGIFIDLNPEFMAFVLALIAVICSILAKKKHKTALGTVVFVVAILVLCIYGAMTLYVAWSIASGNVWW